MSLFLSTLGAGPARTIGLRRSWSCRNRVRAAIMCFAAVFGLVAAASEARAQNCPPGYKIAAGACVQSCPAATRILAEPACIADRAAEAEGLSRYFPCAP